MLKEGMYVRCPVDREYPDEPRQFAAGKIVGINSMTDTAAITFEDPFNYREFYATIPSSVSEVPLNKLERCFFQEGNRVYFKGREHKILLGWRSKENVNNFKNSSLFGYCIQDVKTKAIHRVDESKLSVPFTCADPNPLEQLRHYEFQNPCWYMGRQVVLRAMNVLNNSINGFKTLAGCRIYLKAYQLETIMRCLQSNPMRFMIADEVGLGKTIEVCSILKIYLESKHNQKVLIAVPEQLLSQWRLEMLHKFGLQEGKDDSGNKIVLKSVNNLSQRDLQTSWDFLVVDEVHNCLHDPNEYENIHLLSENTVHVFLLSATPIQQREEEYLKLLRLVLPDKYDGKSLKEFKETMKLQNQVIQNINIIMDNLVDIEEIIQDVQADGENPNADNEVQDELQDLVDQLDHVAEIVNDNTFEKIVSNISTDSPDLGLPQIRLAIAYICENYQIEKNIIRGRRAVVSGDGIDQEKEFSDRKKIDISYSISNSRILYEGDAYHELSEWISGMQGKITDTKAKEMIIPLIRSFFSSPWAYMAMLKKLPSKARIPAQVKQSAELWIENENDAVMNISSILDEPDEHPSRLVKVMYACLNIVPFGKKAVFFTDFSETFENYLKAFTECFNKGEVVGYGKCLSQEESERNMFRFQTDPECHYLICDRSGGEGRNLQMADYIFHIDLPWNISDLEQRIGRLDRMGRDVNIPVTSLVTYAKNSYEEQLFNLWDQGLNVFDQPLSGLEIIMNEISGKLLKSIETDFDSGLKNLIPQMIRNAKSTRSEVRQERIYDVGAQKFGQLYNQLKKLLAQYDANANVLFSSTMMNWAALAGFNHASRQNKFKKIGFNASRFSINAALNTYLLPPDWQSYLEKIRREQLLDLGEEVSEQTDGQIHKRETIWGTFDRDVAIKDDYVHFFAPGDAIFDCIVNNAVHSYKGMCCAFAAESSVNWEGLVYTYSIQPNENILLNSGMSIFDVSQFRSYLASSMKIIPVAISPSRASQEEVGREYVRIISAGYFIKRNSIQHLGKRSFNRQIGASHIGLFRANFDESTWNSLIDKTCNMARKVATARFVRESDLKGARSMINQLLSSQKAVAAFYGNDSDAEYEKLEKKYDVIMNSLKSPIIRLESVCYMRLIDNE